MVLSWLLEVAVGKTVVSMYSNLLYMLEGGVCCRRQVITVPYYTKVIVITVQQRISYKNVILYKA